MRTLGPFFAALLFLLPLSTAALEISKNPPPLREGVLDCRLWDFAGGGIIRIRGQAAFYWGQILGPGDFETAPGGPGGPGAGEKPATEGPMPVTFVRVPSAWNSLPGKTYPPQGFATYRIKILTPPDIQVLGLYMSNQDTAYRMYSNGRLVSSNGVPGGSRETTVPRRIPRNLYLPVSEGSVDLVIQVANFHHHWGGLNNGILIGLPEQITALNQTYIAFFLLLFGGFFLLFLYHCAAFVFRTSDRTHLFLALLTLILSIRVLFTGEYLAFQFFPGVPWGFGIKYEYLSMPLFVFFFALFLKNMFPGQFPPLFIRVLGGFTLMLSAGIILLPARITATFLTLPVQAATLAAGAAVFFYLLRSIFRKETGSSLLAAGLGGLLITAVWDLLAWNRILPPRMVGPMMYPGFLFFVLLNSLVLSRRMAKAYGRLDYLSGKLEQEVAERTRELREANEQIRGNAEAQTRFFIHLSHEIKTPLTLIINYFNSYTAKTGHSRELDIVKKNLDRLRGEIIDFFDIFKWSKGQPLYTHDQNIDFSALIKEKLVLLESGFSQKELTVTSGIEEGLVLRASPGALDRIVNNLLDNAVKYNHRGGLIHVRARRQESTLIFSVEDKGTGIPEENLEDVFLPYYRINNKGDRLEGMGVGLAVAKQIVESLEGTITCSVPGEKGCVFTVTIPLEPGRDSRGLQAEAIPTGDRLPEGPPEPPDVPTQIMAGTGDSPAAGKARPDSPPPGESVSTEAMAPAKTVLVVEDDPEMRALLMEGLKDEYRVLPAEDGTEALSLLESHEKPSLILSDVMMKDINGDELLRILQKDPNLRTIPFLLCTARGYEEDVSFAYDSGALDYIHKPFVLSELKSKIRSLLRFAVLREELARKERLLSYGTVLSGLAHEIRNPLSGILGPLGVIKKYYSDTFQEVPATLKKHFAYIEESIRNINALTQSLKDLYNEDDAPLQELRLKPLAYETLSLIELPPGIELRIDIPEDYTVLGHPFILKISLTQVIKNALDALGKTGSVRIWISPGNLPRGFFVSDNGPGVPSEIERTIFEPFFTTRKRSGMGLGLSLAYSLLHRINWDIRLVPGSGRGACFKLEEKTDG